MPFPYHDCFWTQTAQFVKSHGQPQDRLIAPDEFVDEFPQTHSYLASFQEDATTYPWMIVHKGRLNLVKHELFLPRPRGIRPVFANDVFVVFSTNSRLTPVPDASDHVHALFKQLRNWKGPRPRSNGLRLIPRPHVSKLTVEQIRQEMNLRYSKVSAEDPFSGYEHDHLWDKIRFEEIDRVFKEMIGSVQGKKILELACGMGRNVPLILNCAQYVGNDLSDVAIERARRRYGHHPHLRFQRGDATQLDLTEQDFDLVLAIELVEHVHDVPSLIYHAFRVLKPGGRLILNSANRDSLHLRMVRKMGLPEFLATIEHIREYSFTEMKEILQRQGFVLDASQGVFLLPYYGVPDIDVHVRHLTDDDPEIVEIFRDLGQRAGAEYAFEFIVSAKKPCFS